MDNLPPGGFKVEPNSSRLSVLFSRLGFGPRPESVPTRLESVAQSAGSDPADSAGHRAMRANTLADVAAELGALQEGGYRFAYDPEGSGEVNAHNETAADLLMARFKALPASQPAPEFKAALVLFLDMGGVIHQAKHLKVLTHHHFPEHGELQGLLNFSYSAHVCRQHDLDLINRDRSERDCMSYEQHRDMFPDGSGIPKIPPPQTPEQYLIHQALGLIPSAASACAL